MATRPPQLANCPDLRPVAGRSKPQAVKLLISVRNSIEARMALNAGVDWIDLKEPSAGPLGAADQPVADEVGRILATHPLRSAALGEFRELHEPSALSLAKAFPTVKVGLSGVSQNSDWKQQLTRFSGELSAIGAELVPVVYADWRDCKAPMPGEIADLCTELGTKHILVDTYSKQGNDLFAWISVDEIRSMARQLGQTNCGIVLAGSIKYEMLDVILALPLRAVGVRGAVCRGDRSGSICPNKLQSWVARFNSL